MHVDTSHHTAYKNISTIKTPIWYAPNLNTDPSNFHAQQFDMCPIWTQIHPTSVHSNLTCAQSEHRSIQLPCTAIWHVPNLNTDPSNFRAQQFDMCPNLNTDPSNFHAHQIDMRPIWTQIHPTSVHSNLIMCPIWTQIHPTSVHSNLTCAQSEHRSIQLPCTAIWHVPNLNTDPSNFRAQQFWHVPNLNTDPSNFHAHQFDMHPIWTQIHPTSVHSNLTCAQSEHRSIQLPCTSIWLCAQSEHRSIQLPCTAIWHVPNLNTDPSNFRAQQFDMCPIWTQIHPTSMHINLTCAQSEHRSIQLPCTAIWHVPNLNTDPSNFRAQQFDMCPIWTQIHPTSMHINLTCAQSEHRSIQLPFTAIWHVPTLNTDPSNFRAQQFDMRPIWTQIHPTSVHSNLTWFFTQETDL